jgi:hypothetical protein
MVRLLLPALFLTAMLRGNMADAQEVPRNVLQKMNLGGITVLSDEQGMQVRGRGLGDLINLPSLPDLQSIVDAILGSLNGLPSIPGLPQLPSIPSIPGLPGIPGFPPAP